MIAFNHHIHIRWPSSKLYIFMKKLLSKCCVSKWTKTVLSQWEKSSNKWNERTNQTISRFKFHDSMFVTFLGHAIVLSPCFHHRKNCYCREWKIENYFKIKKSITFIRITSIKKRDNIRIFILKLSHEWQMTI